MASLTKAVRSKQVGEKVVVEFYPGRGGSPRGRVFAEARRVKKVETDHNTAPWAQKILINSGIILDQSSDMLYRNKALSFVVTLICETCKSKGGGMICGRSAISMLFACILLAAPACVLQSSETKPGANALAGSSALGDGIVWSQLSRLPQGATYSRFTPWRSQKKGVLQEVNPKINEDCSFGSPILPNRFITCAILEPVSCRPGTRSPLRRRLGSRRL